MGLARLIKLLCLLIPWAAMTVPGASQPANPNCTTVLTSVRMEVSPLLLYAICLDNNSTTLLTTCGENVWHENVKGFCSSFDLNIGEATIDRSLPSSMITIQLVKHDYTLDAARVVVLTSDHLSKYRISVWGHQDTRFVITIKRICSPAINEDDQNPNSSTKDETQATPQTQLNNPTSSSQYPPPENRHSRPPGLAKNPKDNRLVSDNDNDLNIPEYMRPNKLKVPSRRPTSADEEKDSQADNNNGPLLEPTSNTTSNSLELAKLQWMEDKRVLFEKKMKAIREFYANSELGLVNIREQHGAQDRDELVRGSRKQTKSYLGYEPTPATKGNPYIEKANLETNEQHENATSVLGVALKANSSSSHRSKLTSTIAKSGRLRGSRKQLKQQNYARAKFNQLSRNGGLRNVSNTVWDENGTLRKDRRQTQLKSPYQKTSNKGNVSPDISTKRTNRRFRGFQNRRRQKNRVKAAGNRPLSNDHHGFQPEGSNATSGFKENDPSIRKNEQQATLTKLEKAAKGTAQPINPSKRIMNVNRTTNGATNTTKSSKESLNLLRTNVRAENTDKTSQRTVDTARSTKALSADRTAKRTKNLDRNNKDVLNVESTRKRTRNSGRPTKGVLDTDSTNKRNRLSGRPNNGVMDTERTASRRRHNGVLNTERTTKRTRHFDRRNEDVSDTESTTKRTRNLGRPTDGGVLNTESTTKRTRNLGRPTDGGVLNTESSTERKRNSGRPKKGVSKTERTTQRTTNLGRPTDSVLNREGTTERKRNLGRPNKAALNPEIATKRTRNLARQTKRVPSTKRANERNKQLDRSTEIKTERTTKGTKNLVNPTRGVVTTEKTAIKNTDLTSSTESFLDTEKPIPTHLKSSVEGTSNTDLTPKKNIDVARPTKDITSTPANGYGGPTQKALNPNTATNKTTNFARPLPTVLNTTRTRTRNRGDSSRTTVTRDKTPKRTTNIPRATKGVLTRSRTPKAGTRLSKPTLNALDTDITSKPNPNYASPTQTIFHSGTVTTKTTNLSTLDKGIVKTSRTNNNPTWPTKVPVTTQKSRKKNRNLGRPTAGISNSNNVSKGILKTYSTAQGNTSLNRFKGVFDSEKPRKRNATFDNPSDGVMASDTSTKKTSLVPPTKEVRNSDKKKETMDQGRTSVRHKHLPRPANGISNSNKTIKLPANEPIPSEDILNPDSSTKQTTDLSVSTNRKSIPSLSASDTPTLEKPNEDEELTYRSLYGKNYSGDKILHESEQSVTDTEMNLEAPVKPGDTGVYLPVEEPTIVPQKKISVLNNVEEKEFQQVTSVENKTEADLSDGLQTPHISDKGRMPSNIVDLMLSTPTLQPFEKSTVPDEDDDNNLITFDLNFLKPGTFKTVPKITPTATISGFSVTNEKASVQISQSSSVPTSESFTKPVAGVPLFLPFPFLEDSYASTVVKTRGTMNSDIHADISSVVSSIIHMTDNIEDNSVDSEGGNGQLRVSQFSGITPSLVATETMPEKTKVYTSSHPSATISVIKSSSKPQPVPEYDDIINISPSSTKVITSTSIVLPIDIDQSSVSELLTDGTTLSINSEIYSSSSHFNPESISPSMSSPYIPSDASESTTGLSTKIPTPDLVISSEHFTSSPAKSSELTSTKNQQGVPQARTLTSSSSLLPSLSSNILKIEPTSTQLDDAQLSSTVIEPPSGISAESTPGLKTSTQSQKPKPPTMAPRTTPRMRTSKPEESPKTTKSTVYNATLKPNNLDDESISTDTFWPVVAALVIGIPSVIVFGIAITVIHRRRRPDPRKFFNMKILTPSATPSRNSFTPSVTPTIRTLRSNIPSQPSIDV